jgi:hypothetical protein
MRWLVVAAFAVGCKGKPAPHKYEDAKPAPPPADAAIADAEVDAAPDAASMSTLITPDGVGPITAKMTDEDDFVKVLHGLTVKSEHREAEDYSYDEIIASKGDKQVLRAVVTDDALFKIEVDDPMFTTAAGMAVGMTVADLAAKTSDLKCAYETYEPEADAERVDRALRCDSATLPHILFEIDYANYKGPEGRVGTKAIAKRKIVQIVWLAGNP